MKGVDQDEGLSKMLDSGSSSEDENKKKDDKDKDEVKNYSHYYLVSSSDADPDPSDPYVFGLLDPDPDLLVRGVGPHPSVTPL